MQILKDEVKNKILEAATDEFLVNGYNNSSLRTIAAQAGITIGNIYSYFSSKDDLFEEVVAPAQIALNDLMSLGFNGFEGKDTDLLAISTSICKVFVENKERFFILLNGSAGSKFENMKENIIDFLSRRIEKEFPLNNGEEEIDPLFAKALSSALLGGFIMLFNHYGGDTERLLKLINKILYIFLHNIKLRE